MHCHKVKIFNDSKCCKCCKTKEQDKRKSRRDVSQKWILNIRVKTVILKIDFNESRRENINKKSKFYEKNLNMYLRLFGRGGGEGAKDDVCSCGHKTYWCLSEPESWILDTVFIYSHDTSNFGFDWEEHETLSIAWNILCCSTLSSLSYCHYGSSPCLAYLSSNCNSCKDFWTWNGVCFDSCHSSFLHHVVRQILRCCGWKWKILISHDWFQNVGRKHFTRNIRWKLYKIILTLSLQFWWCRFRWLIIFTPWDSFLKNYYMHNDCLLKLIFKNTKLYFFTNRIKKTVGDSIDGWHLFLSL